MNTVMLIANLVALTLLVVLNLAWWDFSSKEAQRTARSVGNVARTARRALDLAKALEQARMDEVHASRASRRPVGPSAGLAGVSAQRRKHGGADDVPHGPQCCTNQHDGNEDGEHPSGKVELIHDESLAPRPARRVEPRPAQLERTSAHPRATRDRRLDIVVIVGTRRARDTWLKANPGHLGPVFTTSQSPDVLRGTSVPVRVEHIGEPLDVPDRWVAEIAEANRVAMRVRANPAVRIPVSSASTSCLKCGGTDVTNGWCPWCER